MLELRWLLTPVRLGNPEERRHNATRVLQYRVDESQGLGNSWTEWKEVPVVMEGAPLIDNPDIQRAIQTKRLL
jgi:hypothetical protein